MQGFGEGLPVRKFKDAANIDDRYHMTHVFHHGEIVGDKQIREATLLLKVEKQVNVAACGEPAEPHCKDEN